MANPSEKLAESLEQLKNLQSKGEVAIRSSDISRVHRERLLKNGFLKEVMKGWYISSNPNDREGDTTDWYTSYWGFISSYMTFLKGKDWILSAEQSLLLQTENYTVPKQLLVKSNKPSNRMINFLYDTSILNFGNKRIDNHQTKNGLNIFSLPEALINVTEKFFQQNPEDSRVALSMIQDSSDILNKLLEGGHSTIAGRLSGAFRNIGRNNIADDILSTMRTLGYKVLEKDPFEQKSPILLSSRERSPYINRIKTTWFEMRETIIDNFPSSPKKINKKKYLQNVEDVFINDAYHSLSIEGYKVSKELIEKIRLGQWRPETDKNDTEDRNALAARGYWQAFNAVKNTIEKILNNQPIDQFIEQDLRNWFQELFQPSVVAGILKPMDLAGYRNDQVYLKNSKHVPPKKEAVRELMPVFFDLLIKEKEPSVRAVLGHFIFVNIHPYMDGNGRIGRFLMNTMLASGHYPWVVVPLEKRNEYMNSLEIASIEKNILPFTKFIAEILRPQLVIKHSFI